MCDSDTTTLGELVDLVADKTAAKDKSKPYVGLEHIEAETGHLVGWMNAGESTSTNSVFAQGDVLFGKLRPRLRKCIRAPFDGYCSTDILVLRPRSNVEGAYAYYQAASDATFRMAIRTEEGTRMPRTSWTAIRCATYPVHSGDEQRVIARTLAQIDAAIEHTERVIGKLKKIRVGLLHDLLTRGIDEHGELRDPEANPELFHEVPGLGLVPREWEILPLSGLIAGFESGVSVNSYDRHHRTSEVAVLKTSCVTGGVFDPGEHKAVIGKEAGRVRCPPRANSIIVSRMNTPLLVGESAYVSEEYPGLYLPDRLWQTVMNVERDTSVRWLSFVLRYEPIRRHISDAATGTSGSMKNISQDKFLAIEVAVPKETEQRVIAARLEALESRVTTEGMQLRKLQALKHGLMQDLLTGEKRVPPGLIQAEEPAG